MVLFCKPRVCGEKSRVCPRSDPGTESPPRMRGKGSFVLLLGELIRITPACAGKSNRVLLRCRCTWDHPRTCGEKLYCWANLLKMKGSPPRMRGKVVPLTNLQSQAGITPAYAGKRVPVRHGCARRGDHPRVCGEKADVTQSTCHRSGSPPRMRGKGECSPC